MKKSHLLGLGFNLGNHDDYLSNAQVHIINIMALIGLDVQIIILRKNYNTNHKSCLWTQQMQTEKETSVNIYNTSIYTFETGT